MLLIGAMKQEIAQDLVQKGLSKRDLLTAIKRVQGHIDHLRKWEHKIPLKQDMNGVWRFDVGDEADKSLRNSMKKENSSMKKNYIPTKQDFEAAYKALARPGQEVLRKTTSGINWKISPSNQDIL